MTKIQQHVSITLPCTKCQQPVRRTKKFVKTLGFMQTRADLEKAMAKEIAEYRAKAKAFTHITCQ